MKAHIIKWITIFLQWKSKVEYKINTTIYNFNNFRLIKIYCDLLFALQTVISHLALCHPVIKASSAICGSCYNVLYQSLIGYK